MIAIGNLLDSADSVYIWCITEENRLIVILSNIQIPDAYLYVLIFCNNYIFFHLFTFNPIIYWVQFPKLSHLIKLILLYSDINK